MSIKKTKIIHRGDDEAMNDLVATEEIIKPQTTKITEGRLAIDVYETVTKLVIVAPIAGIEISDLEVLIENDVLTIKGNRNHIHKEIKSEHYLCQECFWGNFSRSIILPPNLDTDDMKASFKRGVLNVEISKKDDQTSKTIRISN